MYARSESRNSLPSIFQLIRYCARCCTSRCTCTQVPTMFCPCQVGCHTAFRSIKRLCNPKHRDSHSVLASSTLDVAGKIILLAGAKSLRATQIRTSQSIVTHMATSLECPRTAETSHLQLPCNVKLKISVLLLSHDSPGQRPLSVDLETSVLLLLHDSPGQGPSVGTDMLPGSSLSACEPSAAAPHRLLCALLHMLPPARHNSVSALILHQVLVLKSRTHCSNKHGSSPSGSFSLPLVALKESQDSYGTDRHCCLVMRADDCWCNLHCWAGHSDKRFRQGLSKTLMGMH